MEALAQNKIVGPDLIGVDWQNLLRELRPVVLKSLVTELNGLPYPVQFRNCGAFDRWRAALGTTEVGRAMWRNWVRPETSNMACIADIKWLLENMVGPLGHPGYAAHWRSEAAHLGLQCGVNIGLELKQGSLIEPTPSLDTLLLNSDFDEGLPMRLFCPPFPAQYVRFGPEAARVLTPPQLPGVPRIVDGVFCFVSQPVGSDKDEAPTRQLELSFICKGEDRYKGYVSLRAPVGNPESSIDEWISELVDQNKGPTPGAAEVQMLIRLVNYVVKVFLYLGLKDVRSVNNLQYSQAREKMRGLGHKKQAKLIRHIASFYDSIIVGPSAHSRLSGKAAPGNEVTPHWRRGHFRMQTHGTGNLSRKLIFVAPVMVRADRLKDEMPRPKRYRAVA